MQAAGVFNNSSVLPIHNHIITDNFGSIHVGIPSLTNLQAAIHEQFAPLNNPSASNTTRLQLDNTIQEDLMWGNSPTVFKKLKFFLICLIFPNFQF